MCLQNGALCHILVTFVFTPHPPRMQNARFATAVQEKLPRCRRT